MKILCLYNNEIALPLFAMLRDAGHETVLHSDPLSVDFCAQGGFDLTLSYTYRHILKKEHLDALGNNAVNIHNAYLPFNRGAAPNIWSILDSTPRGVTLHYMDETLDKGAIIAQVLLPPASADETLQETYLALDAAAKQLFIDALAYYPFWREMSKTPSGKGTYHALSDADAYRPFLTSYDMTVRAFLSHDASGQAEENA